MRHARLRGLTAAAVGLGTALSDDGDPQDLTSGSIAVPAK